MNFTKNVKALYNENCKILKKEFKKMERPPIFMGWQN
jgi:hypothetical protein